MGAALLFLSVLLETGRSKNDVKNGTTGEENGDNTEEAPPCDGETGEAPAAEEDTTA